MRKSALLICAFLATAAFGLHTASAQFPKIPRIPKTSQPKTTSGSPEQPSSGAGTTSQPSQPASSSPASAAANTSADDDQPTLNRNSLVVETYETYLAGGSSGYGWVPLLTFYVNGPVPSGSQIYAEFSQPTGGTWLKFDCKTHPVAKGESLFVELCGGSDLKDKGATNTGPVNFSIKMRNELVGTDVPLFTGRAKVGKNASGDPKKPYNYYVDQDWRLPIGYVFLWADDDVAGWDYPQLRVGFWLRGEPEGSVEPHLFYQGKEVSSYASCSAEGHPGSYGKAYAWKRVTCYFTEARAWDKGDYRRLHPGTHLFSEHPGDYEIKVLWHGHLARSIKFSVDPTGNIVDTGVAKANHLGARVIFVPAQILGSDDGNWDRNAWRTEAFYGNPLTGFSPPQ